MLKFILLVSLILAFSEILETNANREQRKNRDLLRSKFSQTRKPVIKKNKDFYTLNEIEMKPRYRVNKGKIQQCLGPSEKMCVISLCEDKEKQLCNMPYHVHNRFLHCLGTSKVSLSKKTNFGCTWSKGPLLIMTKKDYEKICEPHVIPIDDDDYHF